MSIFTAMNWLPASRIQKTVLKIKCVCSKYIYLRNTRKKLNVERMKMLYLRFYTGGKKRD